MMDESKPLSSIIFELIDDSGEIKANTKGKIDLEMMDESKPLSSIIFELSSVKTLSYSPSPNPKALSLKN